MKREAEGVKRGYESNSDWRKMFPSLQPVTTGSCVHGMCLLSVSLITARCAVLTLQLTTEWHFTLTPRTCSTP